ISPWVVTLEALAPFREAFQRPENDPQPLPYLSSPANKAAGAFNVQMEVLLSTQASRANGEEPARLSSSNFRDAYWSIAQLVTHRTVNGCMLQAGELFGTGTLYGQGVGEQASLLELARAERNTLPRRHPRSFSEDYD